MSYQLFVFEVRKRRERRESEREREKSVFKREILETSKRSILAKLKYAARRHAYMYVQGTIDVFVCAEEIYPKSTFA